MVLYGGVLVFTSCWREGKLSFLDTWLILVLACYHVCQNAFCESGSRVTTFAMELLVQVFWHPINKLIWDYSLASYLLFACVIITLYCIANGLWSWRCLTVFSVSLTSWKKENSAFGCWPTELWMMNFLPFLPYLPWYERGFKKNSSVERFTTVCYALSLKGKIL